MRYSFIIPTLNEEKLLPRILEQLNDPQLRSAFSYEVIVSDGGSTDATLRIAKDNADKLISTAYEDCQNIAIGRNRGARAALGEVLVFINADIHFKDSFHFLTVLDHDFRLSRYAAMTCIVSTTPAEAGFADRIFHFFYNNYFILLNVIGMGMGRGECQVIRKEFFKEMNGYDERLAAGEDFDLFRRLAHRHPILFRKDVVVYESPRRYRKFGYFKVALSWTLNAFSILLKGKSISKEWEQVR